MTNENEAGPSSCEQIAAGRPGRQQRYPNMRFDLSIGPLSPSDARLLDVGLRTEKLRRLLREQERVEAEAAADDLCLMCAANHLPPSDPGGARRVDEMRRRWMRIYRKMKAHRAILEKTGSVQRKHRSNGPCVYALRFRRKDAGRTVQGSIYLGEEPFMKMALDVLWTWRMQKRSGTTVKRPSGRSLAGTDPLRGNR